MDTISPADHDWPILTDYLAGVDLITLCENHAISPCDLERFLESTRVAPALAALRRLHIRRAELAAAQAALPATQALSIGASSIPPPLDPTADPASRRLHARQAETARKSAATLLKLPGATTRPDPASSTSIPAPSPTHDASPLRAEPQPLEAPPGPAAQVPPSPALDSSVPVQGGCAASMPSPLSISESPSPQPLPHPLHRAA